MQNTSGTRPVCPKTDADQRSRVFLNVPFAAARRLASWEGTTQRGGVPAPPFCPGAFGVTSIHQGRGCRQVPCDRGRARVALGLLAARSCSGLTPARATSLRARRLFRETLLRWGCASPQVRPLRASKPQKRRRCGCLVVWCGEALRLPGAQCHVWFDIPFKLHFMFPTVLLHGLCCSFYPETAS